MKNALQKNFKKNLKKKTKGSILVLTLVTVNFLLLLSLYLINKIELINSYNVNNASAVLKEDNFQKQKEFVLSRFNSYLLSNVTAINEKGFEAYFYEFNNNPITSYDKASIKYDKVNGKFYIETQVDYSYLKSYFKVDIESSKFKYTFLS